MKKLFGVALLALPFLAASAHAEGSPFNVQAGGSFYIKGSHGAAMPQAGPWYLYWPLDAHPVAPAPTGYPYWPGPQVLPPPAVAAAPGVVPAPIPVPQTAPQAAPIPAPQTAPQAAPLPAPQTTPPAAPQTAPRTIPQGILPPYLQPTGYSPTGYTGQAPSYWYDR